MKKEELIKIYEGSESSVILLKSRLNEIGIESIIKNDTHDAFLGTTPDVVDLYIKKTDINKATPIIKTIK